jgi:Tfp pilus assembly protein PilO
MNMRTANTWYIGAAIAAILVLLAGWLLLVAPAKSNAADLTAQASAVDEANSVTQTKIAALQQQAKGVTAQQQKLAQIQAKIPPVSALPAMIRTLSDAATGAGVTLTSVTPATPAVVPGATGAVGSLPLETISLDVKISGNFSSVRLYLNSLETMQRAFLVTNLTIVNSSNTGAQSGSTAGTGTLTADISGNIFMAPTSTTTAAAAATS